jgi:hypothetical protein
MQAVDIAGYVRPQQLAYWINPDNAASVLVVLQHYPVSGIRDIDISPGIIADGPWGRRLLVITGEPLSLNDIGLRILRPIWRDPRIHNAVNCASPGCPACAIAPTARPGSTAGSTPPGERRAGLFLASVGLATR